MAAFRELTAAGASDARELARAWRSTHARKRDRPHIALNMIVSLDGRVTKDGRSGGLSSEADRQLFHALREQADAIMAGANTVRIERYGPLIADQRVRERRREQGLRPQPYAVIPSRSCALDPELPLLADGDSHVIVIGSGESEVRPSAAHIDYVRSASLPAALRELRERFEVGLLLCEGGPTLAGELLTEGLLDELFITIAPRIVGGPPGPTFLDAAQIDGERAIALSQLLRAGDELFLRCLVASGTAVS